jgi:hypothetical protein
LNGAIRLLGTALCVVCCCGIEVAQAGASCKVVDLMPAFWLSFADGDAAARLRMKVIDPHPELYNENYISLPSGAKWQTSIASERAYVDTHRQEVNAAERYLSLQVQPIMAEFQRTFPDYKCDFTFYIAPSFGQMDGSAGLVNGHPLIIFAPDVIPRYHKLSDLKVLIDHETFHIYHRQSTGTYGASAEAVPTTLNALWTEGLATFISWRMNPRVSLDIALLQPGIPEGANPHLADIAKDLLAHLDSKDERTYRRYFVGGGQPPGYPPRAGYYVGTLVAQDLSARHTLLQLAHLNGAELHALIVTALEKLSAGAVDKTVSPRL